MFKLAPGARLGPYELTSPLGAGGMGEVWKARDIRIGRAVAIKALQRQFANRFECEAQAIAALNHPNICSLFDIGPDYLVMEWIDGVPIAAPHNTRKLLDFAVQIADGLSAAHAAGIIHRDLKPANVLVTREGRVKILDFGLAKYSDAAPADGELTQVDGNTNPGTVMGTVSYMSPEQVRGLPLDARSDQFSLGVMLYELASGERPFQRQTAVQTMAAVIEADPEPLPQTLPAPLRWLVERCLAKEPSGRFESTRDLYRDLNSLRDHLSEISSGTAASLLKPSIHQRTRPKAIVAAIVFTALGLGSFWMGRSGNTGVEWITPVPITTNGGFVQNPSFSPDGSQVAFAWNGPQQEAFNLYVKLIESNDLLRLTNDSSDVGSPVWSPDGKRIAFVRQLGNYKCSVLTISPLGGSERKITDIPCAEGPSPSGHTLLAWTPDGHYLAVPDSRTGDLSGPKFSLASIDGPERRVLTTMTPGQKLGNGDVDPAFSPNGDRFAFVRAAGLYYESRVFWMRLGKAYEPVGPATEIQTSALVNFSPSWIDERQLLLSAGQMESMRLYKVSPTSGVSAIPMPGILAAGGIALSRKGGRLIYPSAQVFENLQRLPLDELGRVSGPPRRLTSTTGSDNLPHYSLDGKSIAFRSSRFGEDGIWTVNVSNSATTALATSADATLSLGDWARDGNSLVIFRTTPPSGHWQLYQIAADTRQAKRLTNDDADDFFPSYSRDGNSIYFSSDRSGKVKLYKMPAAGGPATLVISRNVTNAQESLDRRWLYFADWVSVPGLWRMPIAGGETTRVAESISDVAGYAPTNQGVYFWVGRLRPELHFINLQSHEDRLVFQPSTPIFPNLAISPDARYLCYPQIERNSQELMMIEKFH